MKELLAIVQAMTRARDALNSYSEAGKCFPAETLQELSGILCNEELTCALERIQANVGSPPIAPDGSSPLTKAPIEE